MGLTTAKKLAPAELAALEHAFASEPASNAYEPLAEAYLALGRFMEAMVVCKKGVKAQPDSPVPRVLLARVYAAQGKDRKALEELKGALTAAPSDPAALRLGALLHFKVGETAAGAPLLQQALANHPEDEELIALGKAHGIEAAAPAPPPAAPPVLAPVAAAPVEAPVNGHDAPTPIAPARPPFGVESADAAPAPAARPAPRRAPPRPPTAATAIPYEDDEEAPPRKGAGAQHLKRLLIAAIVGSVLLAGWTGYLSWADKRRRTIAKLLEETNDQLVKDTYVAYKKATEAADQILELDSSNFVAHAYLAYINALRWGEQGEGDDFRRRAVEHLEKAKDGAGSQKHGRITAAQAVIQYFSGEPDAAEKTIRDVLATGARSGQLLTTLGQIEMWQGDLDSAAVALKDAQKLEPNSVRLLAALGELYRRRNDEMEAFNVYNLALRLDKDHADSLLGKALVILDANELSWPKDERQQLLKAAEEQIAQVLSLPPGSISARQLALGKFAQAQLHFARGKRADGERAEQEALTLNPNSPDILLMRGRRLLREGKIDDAVKDIREAIKIDGKRASFYVDLSRALLAKPGGAKEAVDSLQKALETFPTSGRIYMLLGEAYRAVPNLDGARGAFEKALEAEGGKLPEARARLGQIYREKRDYKKAEELLNEAVKGFGLNVGPTVAMALTELGRVYDERPERDASAAFERYRRALVASEAYAPPYYFLGRLSADSHDRALRGQAREAFETYLRLDAKGEHADQARAALARIR